MRTRTVRLTLLAMAAVLMNACSESGPALANDARALTQFRGSRAHVLHLGADDYIGPNGETVEPYADIQLLYPTAEEASNDVESVVTVLSDRGYDDIIYRRCPADPQGDLEVDVDYSIVLQLSKRDRDAEIQIVGPVEQWDGRFAIEIRLANYHRVNVRYPSYLSNNFTPRASCQ